MPDESKPKVVPVANAEEQRKQTALLEAILQELQRLNRKLSG